MTGYRLVIGDKNLSSWSLRPWALMTQLGIPFEEINIRLDQPDTTENILAWAPNETVPILLAGEFAIWDSLAIVEFLHDRHPDKGVWPADPNARARARSLAAEMHAGYATLRGDLSMEFCAVYDPVKPSEELARDIAHIQNRWQATYDEFSDGGRFLFGDFCAVDAFYLPVASRFKTYNIGGSEIVKTYAETLMTLPAALSWRAGAEREVAAQRIS